MNKIQFRLAARTDAAGKFNATAPLEGNEDNMFIDSDLSCEIQGQFSADEVVNLSDKGCLMVVADGMGGMNAGEVASAIAIKTVMEYFDIQHMATKSFRDPRSRMNYMEDVVVAADAAIKADSRVNKGHEGMGSTIIMAWLCDDEICLTWCGDSRAYLFRPGCGFWQVSKDHSYVQGLVDEGKISIDEAFDHPYSNIITRSLGDPEKKAKADSVSFKVYEGDIFMLCSDGLSGVLRDHKTYDTNGQRIETENLEDIIATNRASMAQCRDELFNAAQRNDWYDNVTAILCEIVSGEPLPADMKAPEHVASQPCQQQHSHSPEVPNPVQANNLRSSRISIRKKHLPLIIAAVVFLLGAAGFLTWQLATREKDNYNLEADNAMYNDCETANDYRAYLNQYGKKGAHYKDAKQTLDAMINDSISSAKQTQPEPASNEVVSSTPTNTKKSEPTPKRKIENSLSEEQRKRDSLEEAKRKVDALLTPSGSKDSNLTPVAQKITPKKKKVNDAEEGPKTPANSEEEAFNNVAHNNNVNLENCLYWMETYGDSKARKKYPDHWKIVLQTFTKLYEKKLNDCKTYDDYKNFIDNHDRIMKRARLKDSSPSSMDQRMRAKAEQEMNKLNNK